VFSHWTAHQYAEIQPLPSNGADLRTLDASGAKTRRSLLVSAHCLAVAIPAWAEIKNLQYTAEVRAHILWIPLRLLGRLLSPRYGSGFTGFYPLPAGAVHHVLDSCVAKE
jgi:hypothetical protein